MKYGIIHLSVVPCRAEASDKSEMVTQLLFGETVKTYEIKNKSFIHIRCGFDNYEGFIDVKQFTEIEKEEFELINSRRPIVSSDIVSVITNWNNQAQPIVLGSTLPKFSKSKGSFDAKNFSFDGHYHDTSQHIRKANIAENAYMYLDAPYQWGGRSPFGIDCSGFTQVVYKLNGIKLPRDAADQSKIGDTLSFVEESEQGDLAFFDNSEGRIIHVGIILENNCIIHASGKVRIDKIDQQGIYNQELGKYTHHLRLIKKII